MHTDSQSRNVPRTPRRLSRFGALAVLMLVLALAGVAGPRYAVAQAPVQAQDPFAKAQLSEVTPAAQGLQVNVSGFVDVGYVHITQNTTLTDNNGISWVYGNSQFHFFKPADTFTVNEVDFTVDAVRDKPSLRYGARFSLDFYPSRDLEAYANLSAATETPSLVDVDQAFVFVEWPGTWRSRLLVGRAPGFVTLEQSEADSPDLRLIGHTYAFQAGGGYPYGIQFHMRPLTGLWLRLGIANGGMAAYSFYPGDNSSSNRPEAPDADGVSPDVIDARVPYLAIDWTAFDQPAGLGTLRVGLAMASASELVFSPTSLSPHSYSFDNLYAAYRRGFFEARLEIATLDTAYTSMGWVNADITSLLLSGYFGENHLVTLRLEGMNFVSDQDSTVVTENSKSGITWRYRIDDGLVLKIEAATEEQSAQFWTPSTNPALTTKVVSASWVYSY